jgi:hypothetical protein
MYPCAAAAICSWNNVPHSILPYLRWGRIELRYGVCSTWQYHGSFVSSCVFRSVIPVLTGSEGESRQSSPPEQQRSLDEEHSASLYNWSIAACLRPAWVFGTCTSCPESFDVYSPFTVVIFFVNDAISKLRLHIIVSKRGGPGSIPVQSMWNFWMKKRHCGLFLQVPRFSPVNIISPVSHTEFYLHVAPTRITEGRSLDTL